MNVFLIQYKQQPDYDRNNKIRETVRLHKKVSMKIFKFNLANCKFILDLSNLRTKFVVKVTLDKTELL